jgi:hypothetical protein
MPVACTVKHYILQFTIVMMYSKCVMIIIDAIVFTLQIEASLLQSKITTLRV